LCRSGIADINAFTNAPLLLMYGFMCVAATAAIWDNTATYLGLPVSTTHTTGAGLPYSARSSCSMCLQAWSLVTHHALVLSAPITAAPRVTDAS
jgi:phosphate/sulfate permease